MRILASLICLLFVLVAGPVRADTLPVPRGPVILTVSGDISRTNVENTARFDMEMLRGLPATGFETTTLWTDGVRNFKGVALADLLAVLGVEGGTIAAMALNDYTVDLPVESVEQAAPIIAYEMDGASMPSRHKGPLWIVYPYDNHPKYRSEVIYSRSIWQLDRLVIRKSR